jgi:hypothetical protein
MQLILILLSLMLSTLTACGGDGEHPPQIPSGGAPNIAAESYRAPANTKQAIGPVSCVQPKWRHTMAAPIVVSPVSGSLPSCAMTYAAWEPHDWQMQIASPNPPTQTNGCPCQWVGWGAWTQPQCTSRRSFVCGSGVGCAKTLSYDAFYTADDGNWVGTRLSMRVTGNATPGCGRVVSVSFPGTSVQ